MYISIDVFIWLKCRGHTPGRSELRRVGNYVIASTADRKEFETFRDSEFYMQRPLIKTNLLEQFMKQKHLAIEYCHKFGIDFILNFPSSQFNEMCEWVRNILYNCQASEATTDERSKREKVIKFSYYVWYNVSLCNLNTHQVD